MLPGLLTGTGVGFGLYALLRGLMAPRPPLSAALRDLERTTEGGRAGSLASSVVEGLGMDLGRMRRDLRVMGRGAERHALDKLVTALAFVLLPAAAGAILRVADVRIPGGMVALTAAVLGAAGFLVPDLLLRTQARDRRREFRHALSAYLDLISIVVAGGGGTETALYAAVEAGTGWPFVELRRTLAACRLSGEPPWAALERLGTELGVDELREVAASIGLAGTYGAKVRQSLSARAASLRDHRLAEVESEAQAATEKMSVPVVLMLFGFVAFVMYPALQFVLEGL